MPSFFEQVLVLNWKFLQIPLLLAAVWLSRANINSFGFGSELESIYRYLYSQYLYLLNILLNLKILFHFANMENGVKRDSYKSYQKIGNIKCIFIPLFPCYDPLCVHPTLSLGTFALKWKLLLWLRPQKERGSAVQKKETLCILSRVPPFWHWCCDENTIFREGAF